MPQLDLLAVFLGLLALRLGSVCFGFEVYCFRDSMRVFFADFERVFFADFERVFDFVHRSFVARFVSAFADLSVRSFSFLLCFNDHEIWRRR